MTSNEKKLQAMLDEVQAEFAAFRESSAELEDELEKELGIVEARARKSEEELRQTKAASKDATGQLVREVRYASRRRDSECLGIFWVGLDETFLLYTANTNSKCFVVDALVLPGSRVVITSALCVTAQGTKRAGVCIFPQILGFRYVRVLLRVFAFDSLLLLYGQQPRARYRARWPRPAPGGEQAHTIM